jgi:hypothetical protein
LLNSGIGRLDIDGGSICSTWIGPDQELRSAASGENLLEILVHLLQAFF